MYIIINNIHFFNLLFSINEYKLKIQMLFAVRSGTVRFYSLLLNADFGKTEKQKDGSYAVFLFAAFRAVVSYPHSFFLLAGGFL